MILSFIRWATAPLDRLLAAHFRDLVTSVLTAQALADAQQCPDLVEPPEPEPDAQEVLEPEPIYQEIVSEIVLDAAAVRLWDQWDADSEAWEDERIAAFVERRQL